ncbi:methyltransferase domain-containing protein [Streptomyces sp. NPDC004008]
MHRITTAPVAPIPARTRRAVAAGVGAALAAAWWLGDTAPYPYAQRGLLDVPLPFPTADRMDAVLQPRPGERILEIGPGTGLQSLHVAPQLGPEGRLDVLDIQQEMLDHVMCRAERDGLATIRPTRSDASRSCARPRPRTSASMRPNCAPGSARTGSACTGAGPNSTEPAFS